MHDDANVIEEVIGLYALVIKFQFSRFRAPVEDLTMK